MSSRDLVIMSRWVALPDGGRPAAVVVRAGKIAAVLPPDHPDARGAEDLGGLWLLPGLVDTHVHVNEPGRGAWEGFDTATRAAAVGGVTSLVDMPLNSVPATTSAEALREKVEVGRPSCHVDVGFWGGFVPGNAGELERLSAAGVLGFKCFLVPSGVPEFGHVNDADLEAAAPIIARLGLPLLAHAEDEDSIAAAAATLAGRAPRAYASWLASRPAAAELAAARRLGRLAERWPLHVHVVHVASREAAGFAAPHQSRGAHITLETCPHYLCFDSAAIPDGATEFKCAPPIREGAHREALWEALRADEITVVASDHSPCPPEMKERERGDFMSAWGGIASLELALAAVWTEARRRGFSPAHLARWMSAAPARLAGLGAQKGAIAPGCDADLVAFDPEEEWTVDPSRLHQRHPVTPYAGRRLVGRVKRTWLRGQVVWDGERIHGMQGRMLLRGVEPPAPVG